MAIADKLTKVSNGSRPVPTTLTAARAVGATSISCGALTGWNNTAGVPIHFVIYSVDTSGNKVANSQVDCKGIVSGTTIGSIEYKAGTDNGHSIGAVVEAAPTAAWADDWYDWGNAEHNADGTHDTALVTMLAGAQTITGVKTFSATPVFPNNTVTAANLATNAITLGYSQIVSPVGPSSTATSDTDITGLSVTVTVPAGGRRVKITALVAYQQSGGIGTVYGALKIKEGANVLSVNPIVPSVAAVDFTGTTTSVTTPTAGSHTYKVAIAQNTTGPTFTVSASATGPAFILVEMI